VHIFVRQFSDAVWKFSSHPIVVVADIKKTKNVLTSY